MENQIRLLDYWDLLKKRKKIFLAIFLITFIATAVYTFLSPKVYQARASLIFPAGSEQALSGLGSIVSERASSSQQDMGGLSFVMPGRMNYSTNYSKAVLESRTVLEKVISDIKLLDVFKTKSIEAAVEVLRKNTRIEITKEGLVNITVKSTDPKLAADIANDYIEALNFYNDNNLISESKKKRIFVEKQLELRKAELADAEKKLYEFSKESKILDVDVTTRSMAEFMDRLSVEKSLSEAEYAENSSKLNAFHNKLTGQARSWENDVLSVSSPVGETVMNLKEKLVNLQYDLLVLKQGYSDNHPAVKNQKHVIEETKLLLKNQVEKILKSRQANMDDELIKLEVDTIAEGAKIKALGDLIKKKDMEFSYLPPKVIHYLTLKRNMKIKESLYNLLMQELEKTKIAEAKEAPEPQILDKAVPPERKISPRISFNLILGFIVGIILGIISAVAYELFEGQISKA